MIWGRYCRNWFETRLTLSFRFRHIRMGGVYVARFLDFLQKEINAMCKSSLRSPRTST